MDKTIELGAEADLFNQKTPGGSLGFSLERSLGFEPWVAQASGFHSWEMDCCTVRFLNLRLIMVEVIGRETGRQPRKNTWIQTGGREAMPSEPRADSSFGTRPWHSPPKSMAFSAGTLGSLDFDASHACRLTKPWKFPGASADPEVSWVGSPAHQTGRGGWPRKNMEVLSVQG